MSGGALGGLLAIGEHRHPRPGDAQAGCARRPRPSPRTGPGGRAGTPRWRPASSSRQRPAPLSAGQQRGDGRPLHPADAAQHQQRPRHHRARSAPPTPAPPPRPGAPARSPPAGRSPSCGGWRRWRDRPSPPPRRRGGGARWARAPGPGQRARAAAPGLPPAPPRAAGCSRANRRAPSHGGRGGMVTPHRIQDEPHRGRILPWTLRGWEHGEQTGRHLRAPHRKNGGGQVRVGQGTAIPRKGALTHTLRAARVRRLPSFCRSGLVGKPRGPGP